ncbi:MAG: nuclease-related domain-containing protein [Thiohalobacterales bacterium]|nr:nuclease-related domain-containing protein [Thiohalobacterales bacterium]
MPRSFSELLQQLATNSELQATLLIVLVALAGVLYLLHLRIRRWRGDRATRKIIRRLGARSLQDLVLPDGTGGEVTIDHLLLAPDGLVIVNVMRFDGLIFGGRHTDQWTQVLGRKSYKFENPNHYLQRQINAIDLLVPDAPVSGRLLFSNARFPKDKPDGVIVMGDLKSLPRRPRYRDIPGPVRTAWKQLQETMGRQTA